MASFTSIPIEILLMIGRYFTNFDGLHTLWALTVTCRRNHHAFNGLLYQTHAKTCNGENAMLWGAMSGQIRTLEWAVQNGADINCCDWVGEPPDPNLNPGRRVSANDLYGGHCHRPRSGTALHLAVMMGHDKVVE